MSNNNNEKRKPKNDEINRTNESTKYQNAWRKEILLIVRNIRSGYQRACGDERKKKKNTSGERENYSKPNYIAGILDTQDPS